MLKKGFGVPGVVSTAVGYAGGGAAISYEQWPVQAMPVVRVVWDTGWIQFGDLLKLFRMPRPHPGGSSRQ